MTARAVNVFLTVVTGKLGIEWIPCSWDKEDLFLSNPWDSNKASTLDTHWSFAMQECITTSFLLQKAARKLQFPLNQWFLERNRQLTEIQSPLSKSLLTRKGFCRRKVHMCEDLLWVPTDKRTDYFSLRKQPTFRDATTGFPSKWRLRNERRNSILMTRHYPDLGSASDWLNQISHAARPIRSTNQIWVVTRQQCGISALVSNSQTSFGGETRGSVAKCRLFSQARIILVKKLKHYIWGTACRKRKCLEYYN